MLCFSGDQREAAGLWIPSTEGSNNVHALVCDTHLTQARAQGFGPTRYFAEPWWSAEQGRQHALPVSTPHRP